MKPEPLASSGCRRLALVARTAGRNLRCPAAAGLAAAAADDWRGRAGLAKRSVSIETTAGRAWSATASNAVSVSAAGATCAALGLSSAVDGDARLRPAEARQVEPGREDEPAEERDDDRRAEACTRDSYVVIGETHLRDEC